MATVHSSRLGADLHLGKNDPEPVAGAVAMADLMAAIPAGTLPPIPQHFGTGYDFGQAGWLMLGNGPDDTVIPGFGGCGDCDWAATAHILMQAARDAGRPIPPFSGKTVVEQYAAYVASVNNGQGYDIQTGANDTGTVMSQSISRCQTVGFYDDHGVVYRFGKAITLTPGDIHQLWAATYLLEDAKIGVQLQTAQMDQFDASPNPVWDYVAGSPDEGGHAVPTMGNNGLISWAERVGFTIPFIQNRMDEGHAFLLGERYNAVTGETREGLDDADLEKYIVLVAQMKAAAAG